FIEKDEAPDQRTKTMFEYIDYDHDNKLSAEDWRIYKASMAAENGILAIKPGGHGDVTANQVIWRYHRSIPQLPSTLLYRGVLYMVSDGGILTTFDPVTGSVHKQGRLRPVSERVFASPVAGDGKVYFVSQAGVVTILKAGGEPELLAANDLGEESYATP